MACGKGLLIYRNGLSVLVVYQLLKEENFNKSCENVFFVIEFDLQEDRDLMD